MSDHGPRDPMPDGLDDEQQTERDTSYSPSSERDMEAVQESPTRSPATRDVDQDDVELLPGAGGPDDPGDIDLDPDEVRMPHRDEPR